LRFYLEPGDGDAHAEQAGSPAVGGRRGIGAAGAGKISLAAMASEIVTPPFANRERRLVAYPGNARSFG
jgi:hypothetical protein